MRQLVFETLALTLALTLSLSLSLTPTLILSLTLTLTPIRYTCGSSRLRPPTRSGRRGDEGSSRHST